MTTYSTTSATVRWRGGFDGAGEVRSGAQLLTAISLPAEFGGRDADATPEDLFLAALASCYLATLGIILEKGKVPYESLTLDAELKTEVSVPATITEAIFRPRIISSHDAVALAGACHRAEAFCIVSRAVGTNVRKTVLPEIHPNIESAT